MSGLILSQAFGCLGISGKDAQTFLQGQLSTNVNAAPGEPARITAWHAPDGRVKHLAWLGRVDDDHWWLITEKTRIDKLQAELTRYVLRAQVVLQPETVSVGFSHSGNESGPKHATLKWASPGDGGITLLATQHLGGSSDTDDALIDQWMIAAGVPRLSESVSGEFVGQMLNLDLLGGIDFDKGCFSGQEVLARLYHRGKVKRRLLRYGGDSENAPAPDTRLLNEAGDAQGRVVNSAETPKGHQLLAVTRMEAADQQLSCEGDDRPLSRLPLPYAIP